VSEGFLDALSHEGLIDSPLRRFMSLEFVPPDTVRMPFSDAIRRSPGEDIVQGGLLAAFVDLAGAWTVAGSGATPGPTVDYRIDYLRPARAVEHAARGRIASRDASFVIVDVTVTGPGGKLVAVARLRYVAV
jgi:acyl-coenzyme A thioesterase PaaI-like protein